MSTPSPEKDTLFGPTVHEKIAYQILKMEGFFGSPFIFVKSLWIKLELSITENPSLNAKRTRHHEHVLVIIACFSRLTSC